MHDSPDHGGDDEGGPEWLQMPPHVLSYYRQAREETRLTKTPQGRLQMLRLQDLLQRFLPPPPAVIVDIGGGPGLHACWLASLGYEVHFIDPVDVHVRQATEASKRQPDYPLASIMKGDVRHREQQDGEVDAVLMLGQLFHVQLFDERVFAFNEARRVLRPGGVIMAAAMSRYSMALEGMRSGFMDDPDFRRIVQRELTDGQHDLTGLEAWDIAVNPDKFFTTAFFHQPAELRREMVTAGFGQPQTYAVEGPAWLMGNLEATLESAEKTQGLLEMIRAMETEAGLMGASKHFVAVSSR